MGNEDISDFGLDLGTKVTDLEMNQKILKERTLLIGENLIETKENVSKEITEIKKDLAQIKEDVSNIKNSIELILEDRDNYARKIEVDVLKKQAKMFQPFLTRKDKE